MVYPAKEINTPNETFEFTKPINNHTNPSRPECNRKELIQNVRKLLDEMDSLNLEARCCCTDPNSPPEGTKVQTKTCLDGSDGLMKLVPASKGSAYLWVPPHVDNRPILDPSDACYAPTVAKQMYHCDVDPVPRGPNPRPQTHVGQPARNGLTPQEPPTRWSPANTKAIQVDFDSSTPTLDTPNKDVGIQSGGCNCEDFQASVQYGTNTNTPHFRPNICNTSHNPRHQQGTPVQDYCEDSNFVPPKPQGHQIWTNEPGGTCRYPEYCKAHCFDHPAERDWSRH